MSLTMEGHAVNVLKDKTQTSCSQAKVANSTFWKFLNFTVKALDRCLTYIISSTASVSCFVELSDLVNTRFREY